MEPKLKNPRMAILVDCKSCHNAKISSQIFGEFQKVRLGLVVTQYLLLFQYQTHIRCKVTSRTSPLLNKMYPKTCGKATKKQFKLTKRVDNWFLDTIKPQCTLRTYLVFWTCLSSKPSHSSYIRFSISFRLNVNAPPISLSSSSSKASLASSFSSAHSSPSLVGGDFGARSLTRRLTTSLPLVHVLRAFKSLSKIIWHFGLSCKTKLLLGLSLSFEKKDLFNFIRKYERLVIPTAIPKKFRGVDWVEQAIFRSNSVAKPLHL